LARRPLPNRMLLEPNQRPDPKTQIETKDHRRIKNARAPTVPTIDRAKTNAELRKNAVAILARRIPASKTKVTTEVPRGIDRKSSHGSKEIGPCGVSQMFAKDKGHLDGTIPNFALVEKVRHRSGPA
jgi:hypothetical protein